MKEKIVHLHWVNNNCIAVVTETGKIKEIKTPFLVECNEAIEGILPESIVMVEQVLATSGEKLVYEIQGKHFYHSYFQIHSLQ